MPASAVLKGKVYKKVKMMEWVTELQGADAAT